MLRTFDDMRFLSKYLVTDDPERQTQRLIVKVADIPDDDKEKLLMYDSDFFDMKGYHMITGYEVLLWQR